MRKKKIVMTTNKTADTIGVSLTCHLKRHNVTRCSILKISSQPQYARFTTADTSCKILTCLQQVEPNRGGQLLEATTFQAQKSTICTKTSTLGCITYGPQPQLHTTMQHISTVCSCSALKSFMNGAHIQIKLDRRKRNKSKVCWEYTCISLGSA